MWSQTQITLQPRPRGVHLVTGEVLGALDELELFSVGFCQLFIRHTSASLTLGENASPDVRDDTRSWLDAAVPESFPWTHTLEGDDDMPAHIKSMITGPSLLLPIANGSLALGTWQGIYLCEHRDHGGPRSLVATLSGETNSGA
ncbi:MAG: secondary thiamine-phosphate synthase enzyme YjbQ [Solirubrobacterales bacterium]|nr:secondary thiamine-phosphate synthase enzyme YjbQ [Solirubrobacterales bacterium]